MHIFDGKAAILKPEARLFLLLLKVNIAEVRIVAQCLHANERSGFNPMLAAVVLNNNALLTRRIAPCVFGCALNDRTVLQCQCYGQTVEAGNLDVVILAAGNHALLTFAQVVILQNVHAFHVAIAAVNEELLHQMTFLDKAA